MNAKFVNEALEDIFHPKDPKDIDIPEKYKKWILLQSGNKLVPKKLVKINSYGEISSNSTYQMIDKPLTLIKIEWIEGNKICYRVIDSYNSKFLFTGTFQQMENNFEIQNL